jgi:hypothetical protein
METILAELPRAQEDGGGTEGSKEDLKTAWFTRDWARLLPVDHH